MTDYPAHYGLPGWTGDDESAAAVQGWCVSDCDGSENGPFQICKRDDLEGFDSDEAVWTYVVEQARNGSPLHTRALTFVRANNPVEFDTIIEHCKAEDLLPILA